MNTQVNFRTEAPADLADLPANIQLVWHGVNDAANLRHFLASDVPWAELDVNVDPEGTALILRHDTFAEMPRGQDEPLLFLSDALPRLLARGKAIKIDFKAAGVWVETILDYLDHFYIPTDRLWLNGDLDFLGEQAIRMFAARYPGAIVQIPLHSLGVALTDSAALGRSLQESMALGVNRFSVGWRYPDVPNLLAQVKHAGSEANIYGVHNLSEFLQAIALGPAAVTADFNFPEWHYFGRGSGHKGVHYQYTMHEGPRS
jgi:hypothetical protein